jgi:hypothetical protein
MPWCSTGRTYAEGRRTAKLLVGIGVWILSDAIYSYCLYRHGSQSWRGGRQTWAKDHWVRAVRALLAIVIIVVGAMLKEG